MPEHSEASDRATTVAPADAVLDPVVYDRIMTAATFQEPDRVPIWDYVDSWPIYQHFAPGDIEGDAVDGAQGGAAGAEFHLEIAHGKNGNRHRSFGLIASRSQSPSRLIERMRLASARPGKATIHHSPANR